MKFVNIFIVSYIFCQGIQGIYLKNNSFDGLIKYLKQESKLYQVVFVIDDDEKKIDPLMNSLMTEVYSHFPSLSISYSKSGWFKNYKLSDTLFRIFPSLRSTTLLVIQYRYWFPEKFLAVISRFSPNPRCLLVDSYDGQMNITLKYFWKNNFPDIIALKRNEREPQITLKSRSEKFTVLEQINGITNKYTSEVVSSKSEWFPNKILHLNVHTLCFKYYYPNDSSEDNHIQNVKFLEILRQSMNFKPKIISNNMNCTGFSLLSQKSYLKRNFILSKNQRIIEINCAKAVIPMMTRYTQDIDFSPELWRMFLITIGTIVVIRLIVFLLKFERNTWQTLNISQIIIGMGSHPEPENWTERTIFGSLLITCIVYTGYFYSVIIDISFRKAPEISNFAELAKSHLSPRMNSDLKDLLSESSNVDIQLLSNKCFDYENKEESCLKYLAENQNITCIIENAEYHVKKYAAKYGESNFKILQEVVGYSFTTFDYAFISPHIDRFNKIILIASEFGLLKDFYKSVVPVLSNILGPEEITKEKLLPVLLYVLGIGYSLGFIVFIFELILGNYNFTFV